MNKKTLSISLPKIEGAELKNATVDLKKGVVVAEYGEKEAPFEVKTGDFLTLKTDPSKVVIFQDMAGKFGGVDTFTIMYDLPIYIDGVPASTPKWVKMPISRFRHSTEEEKAWMIEEMEKLGKRYNPKTFKVENIIRKTMKTEPTEALEEIKRCLWTADDFNIDDGFENCKVVDENDAINIANIAFREGQSSPKIKQLEWVKSPFFEEDFEAKCSLGKYFIYDCEGSITLVCPDQSLKHKFSTIDEAKTAAQADFEWRVRECLDLKVQQKQRLIDMMRWDEEIGLYDDNPKNH
jgi:hypothetical protein